MVQRAELVVLVATIFCSASAGSTFISELALDAYRLFVAALRVEPIQSPTFGCAVEGPSLPLNILYLATAVRTAPSWRG